MQRMPVKDDLGAPAVKPKPTLDSKSLFKGGRELIIQHEGQEYRLLITKAGKLILNK